MRPDAIKVPLFKEFAFRGDAQIAQSQLDLSKAQLSDKGAQVDADIRDALLDIQSAQQQVEVARSSVDLANEELKEAQERYVNGVSDNLGVSQAQQSVAQANDQYVTSLYQAQRGQAEFGACAGCGLQLQELFGRKVNVADTNPTPEPNEPITETEIEKPQSRRRGILVAVVVVIVLVAVGIWWRSTFSEDTDDAQVNGHLIQVSSRIAGQVIKVYVNENQYVKAGDTDRRS